jgi:hypothetical protein
MPARSHCASGRSCDRPIVTQHFLVSLCQGENSELVPKLLPSRFDPIQLKPAVLNPTNYLIKFYVIHTPCVGRDRSDSLRTGRSEDRIPIGARFFRNRPSRAWGPSSLIYIGYRFFPGGGVKRPGRGVYHPLHLAPRLKKE